MACGCECKEHTKLKQELECAEAALLQQKLSHLKSLVLPLCRALEVVSISDIQLSRVNLCLSV